MNLKEVKARRSKIAKTTIFVCKKIEIEINDLMSPLPELNMNLMMFINAHIFPISKPLFYFILFHLLYFLFRSCRKGK